jgi:transposase
MFTEPKRAQGQRLHDLAVVADMLAKGMRQTEIAKHFNVSQSQISRDVAAVYEMWAERDAKAIAMAKSKLLTEIQINKKVMRQAWEDSLKPREITSQKQVTTPGGARGKAGEEGDSEPDKERQEASLRTEQRDGNVQFMKELREYMRFEAENPRAVHSATHVAANHQTSSNHSRSRGWT